MDFITGDWVEEVVSLRITVRDEDYDLFCTDPLEHFYMTANMWTSNFVDMGWSPMAWEHEATTTHDELPAATLWSYEQRVFNPSSKTERRESIPPARPTVPPDHNLEMDSRWLGHIIDRSENPP